MHLKKKMFRTKNLLPKNLLPKNLLPKNLRREKQLWKLLLEIQAKILQRLRVARRLKTWCTQMSIQTATNSNRQAYC
jgi:hypothetical protein